MLPEMTIGFNLVTGHERYYTSWRYVDDPSPGRFSYRIEPNGFIFVERFVIVEQDWAMGWFSQ